MGSAFHQLCPRYSGTLTPIAPMALGYGKPLPLPFTIKFRKKFSEVYDTDILVVKVWSLNF